MKKRIITKFMIGLMVCVILFPGNVKAVEQNEVIVNNSVVKLDLGDIDGKVKISKEKQSYIYEYKQNQKYPLQMGLGNYKVQILEKESENNYFLIKSMDIVNNAIDADSAFLESTQSISWENEKSIKNLSDKIINKKDTDIKKLESLRTHILNNYKYDFDKSKTITSKYVPELKQIVELKKGICYDFSVLVAAVLRSEGIKTKLVFGYNDNIKDYHAWNEVYIAGKWEIIDITMDLEYIETEIQSEIFKSRTEYTVEKIY